MTNRYGTGGAVSKLTHTCIALIACLTSGCTGVGPHLPADIHAGTQAAPATLAITNVGVIDVRAPTTSAALLRDQTVLVRNGRITAVGPAGSVRVPGESQTADGRGKFLIPGLWDAHAHMTAAGEGVLALHVAHGITTARDMGSRLALLLDWRRQIESGELIGPRVFVSGPTIEGAWWLDLVNRLIAADSLLKSYPFLEQSPRYRFTTEHAEAAVDSLLRLGVDLLKFRNLRASELRALGSAARARGVLLVGHAPDSMTIGEAAEAGMNSTEHIETITPELGKMGDAGRRAEFERVARAGAFITPTLVLGEGYRKTPDSFAYAVIADTLNRLDPRRRYLTKELLGLWKFMLDTKKLDPPRNWAVIHEREIADLRLARAAGVPLLVGTDAGVSMVFPGFAIHDELSLLVEEVGLSTLEALRGATLYPARSMGRVDSVGAVVPGQRADLVLLDGNPLLDIRNTSRIQAVVLNGRLLTRQDLDQLLSHAERAARQREPKN